MDKSRTKAILEVVTTMLVLVTAVGVAVFFLVWHPRQHPAQVLQFQEGLARGQTLPPIDRVNYNDSDRTLLVVMSVGCSACADSIPFYNRLTKATQAANGVRVVVLFPDSDREVQQFTSGKPIEAAVRSDVKLNKLQVTVNPLLVLLDKAGTVQDFWIGKLTPQTEENVIKSVTGGSG